MSHLQKLYQVSEIELIYKTKTKAADRLTIKQSGDAFQVLLAAWDENKIGFVEQAKVLILNRANQAIGICELATGTTAGAPIEPKLAFIAAIKANASSIILAHNHPSGNLTPSEADKRVTQRLQEGGHILEIPVYDHLIITAGGYYSFADGQAYSIDCLPYEGSSKETRKTKQVIPGTKFTRTALKPFL